MFITSTLFPEFKESTAWRRQAVAHLARHSKASFFEDGCHQERCWGYGSHSLGALTGFYAQAQQAGGLGAKEKEYLKNLRQAYRWFAKTSGPGFLTPGFGDDGIFDCTDLLRRGAEVFPGNPPIDLGVDRTRSYFMKPSGFAFMRNGDETDSIYANVTFGPYAGWHSHFDSLSMNLRLGKTSLLEEFGRFGSYDHPLDHVFRSPEAHNQLLVDGHPYDSRHDEGCTDVKWHSDQQVDYLSGVHHAYRAAPDPEGAAHRTYVGAEPLEVRRTIAFVKQRGYFVVMDSVRAPASDIFNRAISGWWHSPGRFKVLGPTSARTMGRKACLLVWAHQDGLQRLETSCAFDKSVEHAAGSYYSLRARRWFEQSHTGISGFTTVLFPFQGKAPKVVVRPLKTEGGELYRTDAIEVISPHGKDTVILNPERRSGFRYRGKPVHGRARITVGGKRTVTIA